MQCAVGNSITDFVRRLAMLFGRAACIVHATSSIYCETLKITSNHVDQYRTVHTYAICTQSNPQCVSIRFLFSWKQFLCGFWSNTNATATGKVDGLNVNMMNVCIRRICDHALCKYIQFVCCEYTFQLCPFCVL